MTIREKVLAFIKKEYQTEPDRPFAKYPETEVFRHGDNRKWFGLMLPVAWKHFGREEEGYVDLLNVKLEPMLVDTLRSQKGFLPAYHMNKTSWISIRLDGSVKEEMIFDLIEQSYLATASRKKKKELGRSGPKDWIIPANPKYYDVIAAFEESKVIRWKQSSDVRVGDRIYLYVAAPYSAILYQCKAVEVDIPWNYSDENLSVKRAMRIELQEKYEPGRWSFQRLKEYGVYAVRGPRSMPPELSREMER